MATNTPVSSFSGGDEANDFAARNGLRVVALRESVEAEFSLQRLFEQVLGQYLSARSGKAFGGSHPIWQLFIKIKTAIESLPLLQDRRTLRVVPSVGKGNWARVPWLAVIDSREKDAPRGGVYCVFLFREDMTGVYATLNQGVTKPKDDFGAASGGGARPCV